MSKYIISTFTDFNPQLWEKKRCAKIMGRMPPGDCNLWVAESDDPDFIDRVVRKCTEDTNETFVESAVPI